MGGRKVNIAQLKILAKTTLVIFSVISIMSLFVFLAREANAQGPIRVACVGDSITQYSGYPANLQAILGKNYTVGNFGVSGSAVSPISEKPYARQYAFYKALDFQPDIVVIMLGTNDANIEIHQDIANFSTNYQKIISQFQSLPGDQEIILVEPPPILQNNLNLTNTDLVEGVIPQIQKIASDLNLPTVDVYSALINSSEYFGDGVHPSSEGAIIIANEIGNTLVPTINDSANSDG